MVTQLAIKTDSRVKKAAQSKAKKQGVPLSLVINVFLKKYVQGEFELGLISSKNDCDVTVDELFQSKKIIAASNRLSELLLKKSL